MDFATQLVKVKRQGGEGIITLSTGETYEVRNLGHSTNGFVSFNSMCGKYVRHSGDFTFYSTSRKNVS